MPLNYLSHWRVFEQPSEGARENAAVHGFIVQLMKKLAPYSERPLRYFAGVIDPAIRQHRFKLFYNEDGAVAGLVIWAFLDPEVSERVRHFGRFELHDSEWTEGADVWIVDLICLPGYLKHIVRHLRAAPPAEAAAVHYLRYRKGGASAAARRLRRRA